MIGKLIKGINILVALVLIVIAAGVAYIAIPFFGNQALIVRSGSMEPTIGTGSVIVVRPEEFGFYKVGDIIAFRSQTNSNTIITHRITSVEAKPEGVSYKTKGDANEEVDNWTVPAHNVLGRSYFTVPEAGKLLAFAKSKTGMAGLIAFPAAIVILLETLNILKELKKNKERKATSGSSAPGVTNETIPERRISIFDYPPGAIPTDFFRVKPAGQKSIFGFSKLAAIIIPIMAVALIAPFTLAFFGDTETSSGNVFQAAAEFPTPPPPPIAETLVINELLPVSSCNSGQTNGQFIELWNGSDSTVNLKDFSLSDGSNTIAIANSNTDLPSGAFAILVKANGVINQCLGGNVSGAVTVNLGGTIDLNTGIMKLIDTDGVSVLDRVEFGASNSGALQTFSDQSVERNPLGVDTALGDTFAVADFAKQCPVTPGTWAEPGGGCPVVINEIMWPGSSLSSADEWIELRNTTGSPINLAGWKIQGASSTGGGVFSITSGTIPANGYFLIANFDSSNVGSVLNVTPDIVATNVELVNTNAKYTLVNGLGHIVDSADDGSGAPFEGNNAPPRASMQRINIPGDGSLESNWNTATNSANFDLGATELGTPKAAN